MLRKAVEKSPRHLEAWILLGRILVAHGLTTESQDAYCRAVQISPQHQEARRRCPATSYEDWQKEQAQERKQQERLELAYQKTISANQLVDKRQYKKALALYRECLNLDPSAYAHYNLGLVLYALGRYSESAHYLRLALKLNPRHSKAGEWLNHAENVIAYNSRMKKGKERLEVLVGEMGEGFDSLPEKSSSGDDLEFMTSEPVHEEGRPGLGGTGETHAAGSGAASYGHASRALRSLKIGKVPPPSGYRDPAQRRALIAALSDEQIDRELERMRRMLTRMLESSFDDVAKLGELQQETAQAERDAIRHSLMLLIGARLDAIAVKGESGRTLKLLAKRAHTLLGHYGLFKKVMEPEAGTGEHLEMARSVLLDAYGTIASATEVLVDDPAKWIGSQGPQGAAIAAFFIDYAYAVSRWAVARNQLQAVIDNLDRPGGRLDAQKAIARLQEDMIKELQHRKQSRP